MSILTKYRPNNINDIIGNKDTIEIIKSYTLQKTHPHSYLFYGNQGCGKTTTARILSFEYNCELIELNTSNNRGIDTVRDIIIKGSTCMGWGGKNKGFLLDEVHKMTNDGQHALLKILEEPPDWVYFFLCTTDPQKLLPQIRSRCQAFEMQNLKVRDLYPFLIDISKKEGREISKKVARLIAETANGGVRDALNILQKVLPIENEDRQMKIAGEKIEEEKNIIDLCRALLNETWDSCRKILLLLQDENPENIRKIIINYMQKVLLNSGNGRSAFIIEMLKDPIYDYAILCSNIYFIYNT